MTTIELEAQKAELIKKIQTENNESVINKVMAYFTKVKETTSNPPCQYTLEELKSRVEESVEQYEKGESFSQEEVFNEINKTLNE